MSDYFTHFSCMLDLGSAENAARAMELFNAHTDDDSDEEGFNRFELSIISEDGACHLWIRDDGYGDPEHVIRFIKLCATEFNLSGLWGFQYSNTCTRPRVNAFGGGAHVLDLATGETVDWISTDGWLSIILDGGDPHA